MKRHIAASPQIVINANLNAGSTHLFQLPVPLGENVEVELDVRVMNQTASAAAWIRYPGCAESAPSFGSSPLGAGLGIANASMMHRLRVVTDKLGQVAVSVYANGTVVMASLCAVIGAVDLASRIEMSSVKVSTGGRIDAVCNLGAGIVLAGTRKNTSEQEQGKIYRSQDYGQTWTLASHLTNMAGITCIAAAQAGEVYAVAHNSEIWKSTDYGLTWVSLGAVSQNTARPNLALSYGITVTPCESLILLDSAGYVFRSTDGGSSFSSAFVDQAGLYRLQKVDGGILANGWGGKVFKSVDDGITWVEIQKLSDGPLYAIEYLGSGVVLIGTASGKVWMSEDNGDTWRHSQILQGEADDFVSVGQSTIYSTYTGDKQIYHAEDGGRTFVPIGPLKTEPGDWLDHVVFCDEPGGASGIGGTAFGHIVRILVMPAK